MDYKLLHGTGSGAASSPSTAEREAPTDPGRLRSALPDGAFETVDEVEGRLAAGAARACAPPPWEREAPTDPGRPRSALPDGAFETVDEVEGRLAAVAERAPAPLVRPSLEALTSGGKRLRPLLPAPPRGRGGARARSRPARASFPGGAYVRWQATQASLARPRGADGGSWQGGPAAGGHRQPGPSHGGGPRRGRRGGGG